MPNKRDKQSIRYTLFINSTHEAWAYREISKDEHTPIRYKGLHTVPVQQGNLNNLQRETLRKLSISATTSEVKKQLALLKMAYSEDAHLLNNYIKKLVHVNRIFPRFLPTQASGRTSTIDPPITNWPRACIEPSCQQRLRDTIYGADHLGYIEHEWIDQCWSIRDILLPDNDEILITWDHDNIEGKIHDIILNDQEAILAHQEGYDLHTITCCNIFGYNLPDNLRNPHTSDIDAGWRSKYHWQGKDTKQRVLSKNFNHGSKYTKTWRFVYMIKGIEQYGVDYPTLGNLAKKYIKSKQSVWDRKVDMMKSIQRQKISRSLYGFRRVFFEGGEETGKAGFSHMVSGTVSDYNYITLNMLEQHFGSAIRMMHNAHDGDKMALHKDAYYGHEEEVRAFLKETIERPLSYEGRTLTMTAGIKVYA